MPFYSYKAIDKHGAFSTGKMSAANESDIENKLQEYGLDLVSCKMSKKINISFSDRVTNRDKVTIFVHLYQLENAGISLIDSIDELQHSIDKPSAKDMFLDIGNSIKSGKLLSECFADYPNVFDSVCVQLVKAGEKTGNFAEIFLHLQRHYEWIINIQSKIKKAISYPIFLLFVMLLMVAFMMTFVIPKVTEFLLAQDIELPAYTVALINTSAFVSENWVAIILSPFVTYIVLRCLGYFEKIRYYLHKLQLVLPVFGDLLRKIEIVRFCHFFSMTFKSGMGVIECIEVSEAVIQNCVIKKVIIEARDAVHAGRTITSAIEISGEFPSIVVRMFGIGESSGAIDSALANIISFYNKDIEEGAENMINFIKPTLTILMGGMMAWISASVFGPIYSSFGG